MTNRVLSKSTSLLCALVLFAAGAPAIAQPNASPFTSAARYDATGQVTGTIAPDPDGAGPLHYAAARNTYDGAGRLTKVETGELAAWQSEQVAPADWASHTTFTIFRILETTYDGRSRKIQDTLREGASGAIRSVTQYSYDVLGRLECTAVRMNESQFGGTFPGACVQAGGAVPDRITRNVYDAAGQRLQLREGVGTSDEGTEATWAYSPNGKVTAVIDGNGNRAELHYDGYDRQICWIFPSTARPGAFDDSTPASALASAGAVSGDCVTSGDYERYSYDPNGNRTNLRKRDGRNIVFEYDALNRITDKTYPQGGATPVYYSYDLRDLQRSALFDSQSGLGVTNSYDGFGHLISSSNSMTSVARTLNYAYDADGNRTGITHPDGQTFTYKYDGLDRFAGIQQPDTSDVVAETYGTDGQRAVIGHGYTGTGFHYDGVGQLVLYGHNLASQNITWSFTRNAAGEVASTTRDNDAYAWAGHYAVNRGYTANGLNQYTAAGSAAFTYDANGNLTSDGSRTYTYDVENRLVAAFGGVQLGYDPLGRLAWTTGSPNFTTFLYDGDALVAEYDYGGTLQRRYVHGAGADVPLIWYDGATVSHANLRPLYADAQGSIVAVTDFPGNSLAINTYDEYGIPGAANQGRFQYTGQAWLPELGMYYYKARIYSPTLGRFMQTDPIGYADQFNLYEYVGDDPVNLTDSSGEGAWDSVKAAVWDFVEPWTTAPHDIANLAGLIGHGNFAEAFGGMPPTLTGGLSAAQGAATEISALARGGANAERAAARASQIHGELDAVAQTRRTTAVLQTNRGTIVSGGGRDLSAAQLRALRPGETAARGPGAHAEVTALRGAQAQGALPRALGTSRPMCEACQAAVRQSGGTITGPTTAVWQPWWRRWLPF